MVRDDTGTAKAQSNPSTAMPIVVNQGFGSVPTRDRFVFKLEADAALSVRTNTDKIWVERPQKREIRIWQYFSGTQRWSDDVGKSPGQTRGHAHKTHR